MPSDAHIELARDNRFLQRFESDSSVFVAMDRAAYRASIFLDQRIATAAPGEWRVPVATLPQPAEVPRLGWIFHMAHGGSTLLARALDELGGSLVLREPFALRQLALEAPDARLPALLGLLARRYPGEGITIVKANVPVNVLLPELVAERSSGPTILLWSTLEDYLPAILRSEGHRGWLRTITGQLASHLPPLADATDAERVAALWSMQVRRFASTIEAASEVRALESERFFADPASALAGAARQFGIAGDPARIDAVVHGPLFATYSKNPAHAFDNAARIARRDAVRAGLRAEIDAARRWLERVGADSDGLAARLRAVTL